MANNKKIKEIHRRPARCRNRFPGIRTWVRATRAGSRLLARNAAPNHACRKRRQRADAANKLKDSATDLYDHAKESASDSYDAVATKAKTAVNEQKNQFSAGLKTVANSIRHMGGQLRDAPESNRLTDADVRLYGQSGRYDRQRGQLF